MSDTVLRFSIDYFLDDIKPNEHLVLEDHVETSPKGL